MPDQLDWQLLDRVLAGEATPAETEQVRAWIGESPERRAMVEALQRQSASTVRVNVDRAWQRLASRTVRRSRGDWRRNIAWLAAAAVVLAIGGTLSVRMLRTGPTATQLATAWREVNAPLGRRTWVTLPDSSTVVLNAGSSLRYASTFGRADRAVTLRGEGYFIVRHDSTRPFRVLANNAAIQDVGTHFVVRAYDAEHGTIVVVTEGAVGVAVKGTDAHDTVVVTPGVMARMTPTGAIMTAAVETERYTGFAEGLLVLGDLSLAEAVPLIERWYDVTIRLSGPALGRLQLNANFRNEPLSGVLDALSLALDVDVRRDGRVITISPRTNQ
jgi:transmembrane sensor